MIRLNDVPIKELGMFVLQEGNTHPSPTFENKTVKVPGRIGEYHFGSEVGSRPHTIALGVIDPDVIESQARVRKFFELVLDEYGKPKPVKMVYEYEPDKYYTVYVDGSFIPERVRGYINGPINLVAYDPFAYAESTAYDKEPIEYDENHEYNEGHMYPNYMTSDWNGVVQYVGVYNHSHLATPLNIVIEGQVTNPKITVNGKEFSVNVAVYENERLYIDSKTQQVWKVNVEEDFHGFLTPVMISQSSVEWERMNIFGATEGEFPHLNSGDNSIMFFGGNPSAKINLDWKHRFL